MFSLLGLVCVPFISFYLSLVRYGMGVKFESYGHHPLRGGGIGGPNVLFVHSGLVFFLGIGLGPRLSAWVE